MIKKTLFILTISLCSVFIFSSIFGFRGYCFRNHRKGFNMRNIGNGWGRGFGRGQGRGRRLRRGPRDGSGPNPNCPLKNPNVENPNPRNPKRDGTGPNKDGKGPRGTNLGPKEDCPNK